ncbi:hypothetical protein BD289DRAFT_471181 [Coniella lustricola]|uniref:F-box domain-containing protein n=1 Tax=Coniella lustricola TaxID=2025994 RepID=A0A2T3AKC0_9PEZI|nr:hypothetical protein BD289DRAFT_471181 [Coniella lustricola]
MTSITRLPPELISQILSFVNPKDLASVNLTCQYLYHTVCDNSVLFHTLYLRHLDDPGDTELDWIKEVKDMVKLEAVCASTDAEAIRKSYLDLVHHTTTRLLARCTSHEKRARSSVSYRPSRNTHFLRRCFANPIAVEAILCQSSLFERKVPESQNETEPVSPPASELSGSVTSSKSFSPEAKQISAKLHCLHGAMIRPCSRSYRNKICAAALERVYDMRRFTRRNRWGPFLDEGPGPIGIRGNESGQLGPPEDHVDWEMMEAIMVAIWINMKFRKLDREPFVKEIWGVPFSGCWPNSYIPAAPGKRARDHDLRDPYGVAGVWLRFVCFLDYHDFFAYNFPHHSHPGMPRSIPDFNEFAQAGRLIVMKLHVTKITEPGPEDGQALPVVHFEGIARAIDDTTLAAHLEMKGSVRLTRQGEVHWTSVSSYHGEARWRSESIQLGGVQANKVVGTWFDTDYDASGPCGPSAFWKLSDRVPNTDDEHFDADGFFALRDSCINLASGPPDGYDEDPSSDPDSQSESESNSDPE